MNETDLQLSLNGRRVQTRVPNRLTLAEYLREKEGLLGTKVSCESQVCGACTALMDGRPVSSCSQLAVDAHGTSITTIEGLGDPGELHPIQQSFVECTALQCGFCTPGFILATQALLERNPNPGRVEIMHELEGNLCRCTGYLPIIEAVERAAARLRGEEPPARVDHSGRSDPLNDDGEPFRYVGHALPRVDARAKVTGEARYALDLSLPGTLTAVVVRSEFAHAQIRQIDTEAALEVPGCVAVVTGADLGRIYPRFGHLVPDHPILALGKVRYFGEPVALVIGVDKRVASDAARLVEVDYEELPAAMDAAGAMAANAPVIHEDTYSEDSGSVVTVPRTTDEPNVANTIELGWGDVDDAFASADLVAETTTHHPALYAYAMEPYNASAQFTDGYLDVISCAQHPFMVVKDLARVFNLPQSHVRLTVPYIGGGYGSKSYTKVEPLAAVGAWATGRAVKLDLSIEESIYTTRADSATTTVRSAFSADGTLLARDVTVVMDTGAYVDNSSTVLLKAVHRCFGPYRIPHLRVRGHLIYTNTVPASSYRALGAFQVNLAGETNIDQAAEQFGMDAGDLRLKNLVAKGESFVPGMRPMDADLGEDLTALTSRLRSEPRQDRLQGIGFGCGANEGGVYPTSTAQVKVSPDGSVLVLSGSTEMGQGSKTVLAQVAAEELQVQLSKVRVFQADSAGTSYERTTGGSRTTTMTGLAVLRACHDVRRQLRAIAADLWGCPPDNLVISAGQVADARGRSEPYGALITRWFGVDGAEVTGHGVVRREGDLQDLPPFWEIGMVGVAIDIDPDTGVIDIDQLVTVADVGLAINPAGVEGQDLGAAMQGIGAALSEELVYEGQQLRNPNLVEYQVPHIDRVPRRFDSVIFERRDGCGPYGAKGVGEGARIPVGSAMAAAVARATGIWPDTLPLTPERVWRLIQTGTPRREASSDSARVSR